jgi:phosphonate transport system substrate-binding protein
VVVVPTRLVSLADQRPYVVTREVTRVVTTAPPTPVATGAPQAVSIALPPRPAANATQIEALIQLLVGAGAGAVEVTVVRSYPEAIDALCTGRVALAWLATPAYLIAQQRCDCHAELAVQRDGRSTYRAQLMVLAPERRRALGLVPITTLADLDGRVLGWTVPDSPTGYYLPKALLLAQGLRPSEELFWGGDSQAVLAVYRGEVDAAAGYWGPLRADGTLGDARHTLADSLPDIGEAVRILQLSAAVPNDPLVWAPGLDDATEQRLLWAWANVARSDEGRAWLQALYGVDGLALVADADYDTVRQMVETLGLSNLALMQATVGD